MDIMECPIEMTNVGTVKCIFGGFTKMDFVSVINDLRLNRVNKYRMNIPLCPMQHVPMVYAIIYVDVHMLDNEFVYGYCKGDHVLYLLVFEHQRKKYGS